MMIMLLTMMKLRSTMVTVTNLRLRRLMVTLMRLRIKLMITEGGVTLTINKVKMLHAFFEERGRLYTPLTMMLMMIVMMMMITRLAKTIMMCQY